MSLFQKSVLNKYLKTLEQSKVDQAYKVFTEFFHNETIKQNIREDKEEQFQYGFLQKLFDNVLDYTINPNPEFDLTTEFKNLKGSKKADGAILKDGKAIGVIELKSTKTKELSRITDQAFGYKNNHPTCNYIITSNFEKLRFYINDAVEHIDFDLFTLTPDDFKVLYLCLQKDQVLGGIPLKIKLESTIKEEDVTKQLYKDYSAFKKAMFNDMVARNPEIDKLHLFEKSQKLLDRFLFIFFAEDKGLLMPNTTGKIIARFERLKADDFEKPLYDIFKQFFGYIDKGRPAKGDKAEIFAFNGGLFHPDEILDNLIISDEAIRSHAEILTAYDFASEVDVNILGHIFEHSLNEIDQMTAELEGKEIDKSKTKRKKDGVFYTPKYITKYIVDNTVGKLAEAKKEEIKLKETDFKPNRKKATKKKLLDQLKVYRDYLLSITICDPACGSGAFLNQALDYLIKEHRYIDELQTKVLGGSMVLSDITNDILEKNIYGVDINAESVDIAKLALWLRTAQKGRPLTSLNNNIKCGNSLIDDPEVAGDKAFDWEKEFPEVFERGGFDVVIGNPPYVRAESILEFKQYLESNYSVFQGNADLYVYFFQKGFDLIKPNAILSYITPNKWIQSNYGINLREFIRKYSIDEIIDFGELQIFEDAGTFPSIIFARNNSSLSDFNYKEILKKSDAKNISAITESVKIDQNTLSKSNWVLKDKSVIELINKLQLENNSLGEYFENKFLAGIKTGANALFIYTKSEIEEITNNDSRELELFKPILFGQNFQKYVIHKKELKYVFFPYKYIDGKNVVVDLKEYPIIYNYFIKDLDKFSQRAIIKEGIKKGTHHWYELQQVNKYFDYSKPKLIYPDIAVTNRFLFVEDFIIPDMTCFFIPFNNHDITPILNSSMFKFLASNYCPILGNFKTGGRIRYKSTYMSKIPFPKNVIKSKFTEKAIGAITSRKELLKLKQGLINLLQSKYVLDKVSGKLENWNQLDFSDFLKELKKQKIKLSLSEQAEWMEYFETEKEKALIIQAEIDRTDVEIDKIVYELYGLTDEEVAIVEAATA